MTDSNAHFRSVLRGYDPAQVDQRVQELAQAAAAARQEAGERTIEVSKLEAAVGQLRNEVERQAQRAQDLEEAQVKAAAPTYAGLGERIGSILTLADKEASEMRALAQADAASHHALADESALSTRQGADDYALETRSAVDTEAARILEDAKRQADSLMDDADRQAMARREEAEAVYERARAKSAAAAVDFETTLAARRDASAQELVAQVAAAEQQLAAIQQRSEQTRAESEQAQQEAATRSAHELEQASAQGMTLVAEAKAKAERIRGDSERELAAATQRRDSINAQLTNVRQMLATLGGAAIAPPSPMVEPAATDVEAERAHQNDVKAEGVQQEIVVETSGDQGASEPSSNVGAEHPNTQASAAEGVADPAEGAHADDTHATDGSANHRGPNPRQRANAKR